MQAYLHKFIIVLCLAWSSWLGMMLVHETGHALAVFGTHTKQPPIADIYVSIGIAVLLTIVAFVLDSLGGP